MSYHSFTAKSATMERYCVLFIAASYLILCSKSTAFPSQVAPRSFYPMEQLIPFRRLPIEEYSKLGLNNFVSKMNPTSAIANNMQVLPGYISDFSEQVRPSTDVQEILQRSLLGDELPTTLFKSVIGFINSGFQAFINYIKGIFFAIFKPNTQAATNTPSTENVPGS